MAHEFAKCIQRKLNVADFQSKVKKKYTLNVNIRLLRFSLFFFQELCMYCVCLWTGKTETRISQG